MSQTLAIMIATIFVILATIIPTYVISKRSKTSEDDWAVASRSLPIYVVIGTQLASAMGGGILVGQLGFAYLNGISILFYGFLVAITFFVIMIPAKWLRHNNFTTVPEILKHFSNNCKFVTIVSALMTIAVPFGWITSQITAFGSIYSSITEFDYDTICIFFAIVSLLFVMPAGLKTVAWTDFIFACFMISICVICLFIVTDMGGGIGSILENVEKKKITIAGTIEKTGLATLGLWFFSVLPGGVTNQLYFQRVCAIDDEKQIIKSLSLSAFLIFIVYVWAVYMGISLSTIKTGLTQDTVTGWFMSQLPTPLLAGFAALVFATMMSTVSSGVQSVVVNITRDIIPTINPNISSEKMLKLSRLLSLITMLIAVIMCLKFTDTLKWLVATYALSAASLLCPIYVGYFFRNSTFITKPGLIAGMMGGFFGCLIAMTLHFEINYALVGIICSLVLLLGVSFFTQKK